MLFSLATMSKIQKKIETKVRLVVCLINIITKAQPSVPPFMKVVFITIIKVTMLVIGGFINCGVDNLNFAPVERLKSVNWRFKRRPSSERMNNSCPIIFRFEYRKQQTVHHQSTFEVAPRAQKGNGNDHDLKFFMVECWWPVLNGHLVKIMIITKNDY